MTIQMLARLGCVGLLSLLSLQLVACAAVAGDVAGSLAERSVDALGHGKVKAYQVVQRDEAINAVRKVAADLDLKLVKEQQKKDRLKLIYMDKTKEKIVVTVLSRTDKVTEVRTDVGLFGAEGMARLFMRQILRDLPGLTKDDMRAME